MKNHKYQTKILRKSVDVTSKNKVGLLANKVIKAEFEMQNTSSVISQWEKYQKENSGINPL